MIHDTLSATRKLEQAGIEKTHAEAITLVLNSGQDDFAMKTDIDRLEREIQSMKDEFRIEFQALLSEIRYDNRLFILEL